MKSRTNSAQVALPGLMKQCCATCVKYQSVHFFCIVQRAEQKILLVWFVSGFCDSSSVQLPEAAIALQAFFVCLFVCLNCFAQNCFDAVYPSNLEICSLSFLQSIQIIRSEYRMKGRRGQNRESKANQQRHVFPRRPRAAATMFW